MRLVVEYSVGDGYTYSGQVTVPVEYESAEAFVVNFEKFIKDLYAQGWSAQAEQHYFAGQEWDVHSFFEDGKYFAPSVMTVDEWFEQT